MTREEAIEILKQFKKCLSDVVFDEKGSEAWQMAIQALSQEPTDTWSIKDVADTFTKHGLIREQEPCDDAISRQAVIERLKKEDKILYTPTGLNYLIRAIEGLSPVTQKCDKCAMNGSGSKYCDNCGQKSGKWIRKYDRIVNELYWECNKCGEGFQLTSNFCPNCGAKMESEDRTE